MEVYVVTNTYANVPVRVFTHYLFASEYLNQEEDKGASFEQYRIDGPYEVINEVTNYRLCSCNAPDGLEHIEGCPLAS